MATGSIAHWRSKSKSSCLIYFDSMIATKIATSPNLNGQHPMYQLATIVDAFIMDSRRMLDGFCLQHQFNLHRCVGFVANVSGYILWGMG